MTSTEEATCTPGEFGSLGRPAVSEKSAYALLLHWLLQHFLRRMEGQLPKSAMVTAGSSRNHAQRPTSVSAGVGSVARGSHTTRC